MSTGPEHYREAEHLLEIASEPRGSSVPPWVAENIAAAQVHATLALAAATAQAIVDDAVEWSSDIGQAWAAATAAAL